MYFFQNNRLVMKIEYTRQLPPAHAVHLRRFYMRTLSDFLQSISKRRERERKQRAGIVGDLVYYNYNAPCNFSELSKSRRKPFGKKPTSTQHLDFQKLDIPNTEPAAKSLQYS